MKDKQDQLLEALNAYQPTPDQRELLARYVEGMTGICNARCLTSEDLQALAGEVWLTGNEK